MLKELITNTKADSNIDNLKKVYKDFTKMEEEIKQVYDIIYMENKLKELVTEVRRLTDCVVELNNRVKNLEQSINNTTNLFDVC